MTVRLMVGPALAGLIVCSGAAQAGASPVTLVPVSPSGTGILSLSDVTQRATPNGLLGRGVYVGHSNLQKISITASPVAGTRGINPNAPATNINRVVRAEDGTVRWMEGALGQVSLPPAGSAQISTRTAVVPPGGLAAQVLSALRPYAGILRLSDPSQELRPWQVWTDERGWTHLRFDQVYQGVRVWSRDLTVHVSETGAVRLVNAAYVPTPAGVDMTPARTAEDAIATAKADLTLQGKWAPAPDSLAAQLHYEAPNAELVVYPSANGPKLAYAVDVRPNVLDWYTYLVDAHTGAVLHRIYDTCSASFGDASGTDLNGVSRAMRTWKNDGGVYFMLWDLPNYVAAQSAPPNTMAGGAFLLDLRNKDAVAGSTMYFVTSPNNQWSDPSSVSAIYNGKVAYDYYHTTFNRKAIDDQDSTIVSIIHVTENGASMENAYWNGKAMFYGDGGTNIKPLAGGLDVAGHELTHGVIDHTANLIYQDQSGALNESFADVFGVMIDRNNLLIGEDVMQPGKGIAMRDLENPANPQVFSKQPATMANYFYTSKDNGGVHTNSGIPNHAAALIINAIGREKTEQIYYHALSTYLNRNSQFLDCRNAVEQAAKDKYPADATVLAAVITAWDTVGVKTSTTPPVTGGETIPPVSGGTPYITMLLSDGSIAAYGPSVGSIGVFSSAPKARMATNVDESSQLSTPLDGGSIWYVDATGHIAYQETATGNAYRFPGFFIESDGDIYNCNIAPDGSLLTFVRKNDRRLFLTDFNGVYFFNPDLEASDGGAKDTSVVDVYTLSWSPNMGFPRIGFDAVHQINVNGTTQTYWGIGEINSTRKKIYDLVPGQPAGISIADITYSNTDPNTIAYNAIASVQGGLVWDMVINKGGDAQALGLYTVKLNDGSFLDNCQRPTFSPDDKMVCIASPDHAALVIYEIASNSLQIIRFTNNGAPLPVFNPRWFVFGGTVPYTFADVATALAVASGMYTASSTDMARLNLIDTGTSQGKIAMDDAVRIARKVTGMAP